MLYSTSQLCSIDEHTRRCRVILAAGAGNLASLTRLEWLAVDVSGVRAANISSAPIAGALPHLTALIAIHLTIPVAPAGVVATDSNGDVDDDDDAAAAAAAAAAPAVGAPAPVVIDGHDLGPPMPALAAVLRALGGLPRLAELQLLADPDMSWLRHYPST